MSAQLGRQTWALLRRNKTILCRHPLSSFLELVVFPGIIIASAIHYLSGEHSNADMLKRVDLITTMCPMFSILNLGRLLARDTESGFKSLMISMGLRRSSYYLANAIYFVACNIVFTLTIVATSALTIFSDSLAPQPMIVSIFLLLLLHLAAFVLVVVTLIRSELVVTVVLMFFFRIKYFHVSVLTIMHYSSPNWWPIILFVASVVPYESIDIFNNSYFNCKNCNETKLSNTTEILIKNLKVKNPKIISIKTFVPYVVAQPTVLILLAMLTWTLVALAASLWLDEFCPWQKGFSIKRAFFCLKRNADQSVPEFEDDSTSGSVYFERSIAGREVSIQVCRITKKFHGIAAVDNVDLSLYKGETTLLLGHNGAGKTALIDMILGNLEPDGGSMVVKAGSTYSRKWPGLAVGYCPQTSVLDNYLSVSQHLELFADIKSLASVSKADRNHRINLIIDEVGLGSHRDKLPSKLSGEMKRRLSLAMALIGDSRVLVLDEPSLGLDPDSRMLVWDAIRRYRADRTVLISTQHMEEADSLGDRIVIMNKGRIVCCGSPVYLNSLFGGGYKLRVECNASELDSVLASVRNLYPPAKLSDCTRIASPAQSNIDEADSVLEMVIDFPEEDESKDGELGLLNVLDDLENNSSLRAVRSFGLRSPSIEDVFLNISRLTPDARGDHLCTEPSQLQVRALVGPPKLNRNCIATNYSLVKALLRKHLHSFNRNIIEWAVMRITLPLLLAYYAVRYWTQTLLVAMLYTQIIYLGANATRETLSKFKTVQLTSHANYIQYWLSQLIVDLISPILVVLFVNLLFAMDVGGRILVDRYEFHLLLSAAMLLFITTSALLAYILSRTTTETPASVLYEALVDIFIYKYVLITLEQALSHIGIDSHLIFGALHQFLIAIVPADSIMFVIAGLADQCYLQLHPSWYCKPSHKFSPVLLGFMALIAQTLVFAVVLFAPETVRTNFGHYFRWRNICRCFIKSRSNLSTELRAIDPGVAEERNQAFGAIKDIKQSTHSLVAADLSKSYLKGTNVVENLSFTVKRGECFGLLGANGAGKTTAVSMLIGELQPDSGSVCANGRHKNSNTDKYSQQLGYDPQVTPDTALSPREAFSLIARLRLIDESSISGLVQSLLELLDMTEHADKSMRALSVGTKRKASLGMSLIGNPPVLVLDEPTAGLDPTARRCVWRLLRQLKQLNQSSIVMSSNAMEQFGPICDRIAVMAGGRLLNISSAQQLRAKFQQGCRIRIQFLSDSKADRRPKSSSSSKGEKATIVSVQPADQVHSSPQQVDVVESSLIRGRSDPSRPSGTDPHEPLLLRQAGQALPLNAHKSNERITQELIDRLKSIAGDSVEMVDRNVDGATIEIKRGEVKRSSILRLLREIRQRHPRIRYSYNDCSLEDVFIAHEDQLATKPTASDTVEVKC